ncbi:hypothetical protein BDV95DRAFT_145338 [Massariosphaeria phaeospora]|uniref:Uncharacterized protein n=1 Tax=Massariosphaeria phaeospora TaxID=100035 RepID=A0A7C8MI33_9PLEO|nr:hypothetical protein BDV95DRAFT_145338 [Massariosphaeria phaeospora]
MLDFRIVAWSPRTRETWSWYSWASNVSLKTSPSFILTVLLVSIPTCVTQQHTPSLQRSSVVRNGTHLLSQVLTLNDVRCFSNATRPLFYYHQPHQGLVFFYSRSLLLPYRLDPPSPAVEPAQCTPKLVKRSTGQALACSTAQALIPLPSYRIA